MSKIIYDRCLECVNNRSNTNKGYRITITEDNGNYALNTSYGRLDSGWTLSGAPLATSNPARDFGGQTPAVNAANEIVRQKEKKGYVRVTSVELEVGRLPVDSIFKPSKSIKMVVAKPEEGNFFGLMAAMA
jgi:predicted DNA-binding WGR domain protein